MSSPTIVEVPIRGPDYEFSGDKIVRMLNSCSGIVRQTLNVGPFGELAPEKAWHLARLRHDLEYPDPLSSGVVRIVDLFSGAGGLSAGVSEAVRSLGWKPRIELAADIDSEALDIHANNFRTRRRHADSVRGLLKLEPLVSSQAPHAISQSETRLDAWPHGLNEADIVIGGPPCQGHSNLNNRTRRTDARNELYLWMALAAHATRAKVVIIENVASVKADAGDAVGRTIDLLERLGYAIGFDGVLGADRFGVAQTRRRHFLIAILDDALDEARVSSARMWLEERVAPKITVLDAIGDLQDIIGVTEYDRPSIMSAENQERIDYLHDQAKHDLPDNRRPLSHRDGHTYPSVYGRMYGHEPSQTLTTGFLTPGRGRYIHPTRRRTLTPHEASRLQGFPDDFRFVNENGAEPGRTRLAKMIGDAVPPPLAFHVALAGLQMLANGVMEHSPQVPD